MSTAVPKICVECLTDLAGTKRIKDPKTGFYYCPQCLEELRNPGIRKVDVFTAAPEAPEPIKPIPAPPPRRPAPVIAQTIAPHLPPTIVPRAIVSNAVSPNANVPMTPAPIVPTTPAPIVPRTPQPILPTAAPATVHRSNPFSTFKWPIVGSCASAAVLALFFVGYHLFHSHPSAQASVAVAQPLMMPLITPTQSPATDSPNQPTAPTETVATSPADTSATNSNGSSPSTAGFVASSDSHSDPTPQTNTDSTPTPTVETPTPLSTPQTTTVLAQPTTHNPQQTSPEYIHLAQMMSNPYTSNRDEFVNWWGLGTPEEMSGVLEATKGVTEPGLKLPINELKIGFRVAREIMKDADDATARADAYQQDVQSRAANGDFTHQEDKQELVGFNNKHQAIYKNVTEEVDDSDEPQLVAWFNRHILTAQPDHVRDVVRQTLETARLQSWTLLLKRQADFYPPSPQRQDLISVEIKPRSHDGSYKGYFSVTNTSGINLTNVTVGIDLVKFTDAPSVASRQVVFFPAWDIGQTYYLNTVADSNLITPETSRNRPLDAKPGWNGGQELVGVGGVVEARFKVWADQAHADQISIKYPKAALACAEFDFHCMQQITQRDVLGQAARFAEDNAQANGRPANPMPWFSAPQPQLLIPDGVTLGQGAWVFIEAPFIAQYAPGSEFDHRAAELAADPVGIIRKQRQHDLDILTSGIKPGKSWSGTWTFQLTEQLHPVAGTFFAPNTPLGGQTPDDDQIKATLKRREGQKGIIRLAFNPSPKTTTPPPQPLRTTNTIRKPATNAPAIPAVIHAELFLPDHPSFKQELTGQITNNEFGEIVLKLTSAPKPPAPYVSHRNSTTPKPKPPDPPAPAACGLDSYPLNLEFTVDGTNLKGFATANSDPCYSLYQFDLLLR